MEINADYFISRINIGLSKDEVKEKFDYMFNRIGSKKAIKIANPFYQIAQEKLEKVVG